MASTLTATIHLRDNAQALWTIFKQRVNPLIRISFNWDLDRLESATVLAACPTRADDAQDALLSSIYLASIVSVSDAECETKLHRSKSSLLSEFQTLCEEALARTNILCMKNIVSLKAMAIYLVSISLSDLAGDLAKNSNCRW